MADTAADTPIKNGRHRHRHRHPKGYKHLHLRDQIKTYFSSSCFDLSSLPPGDDNHEILFGEPLMSNEDWSLYRRQIHESEGFDAELYKGRHDWEGPALSGTIYPVRLDSYHDEFKEYVEFAIEKQQKKDKIVLERIVKGNVQVCAPCNYYITFEAKDMDDGGLLKTYQTLVMLHFPLETTTVVEIFREKPAQY